MGPKAYAIKSGGNATKETSWMDRMCQKIETYCELGEPGRGPSLIIQEIEVQFNTFGAGLRKFANEANDFVQDLLNVPIIPSEGIGEKVVDLPKQRDMKVVHGEQQVAKQPAKQATAAAPMNFFDEACMKMSKKGESKEDLDTAYNNRRTLKVQSVEDSDKFPFAEVAWDWPQQPYYQSVEGHTQPQQPFNQSVEAHTQPQQPFSQSFEAHTQPQQPFNQSFEAHTQPQLPHDESVEQLQQYQELGQASCASLDFSDSEMDAFMKEETIPDIAEDVKNSNEMVEGEDHSTLTWSSTDDAKESRRDATSDSSLLDGWEGDDIVIDEEVEEEDELDDWEIV
jgi:hypothetical protein